MIKDIWRNGSMIKKKVFISFDYSHDKAVKGGLVYDLIHKVNIGIQDISISEPITDHRWQTDANERIASCDYVIFICGKYTDQAKGVEAEMTITKNFKKPYLLIRRCHPNRAHPPVNASSGDEMYRGKVKRLIKFINGESK